MATFQTTITTETLDHDGLDNVKLAAPVANAIRDAIAAGIQGITAMARDGKHRQFNRTGALVAGLHVEQDGDAFAVLPPDDHFQGPTADVLLARLVELVPVIADPTTSPRVQKALEVSSAQVVKVGRTVTEKF